MKSNDRIKINLPVKVNYIIERLERNGYAAYAVGGCVRDSLIGKKPTDWDICTNALPEETERIFPEEKIIETGLKHGTVTILIDNISYEVTTFRTESGYSDCRRPDSVNFVKAVSEDLKRRDFTVNAMAYNSNDGLIDLYGGRNDLKNRVIRCVGNPHERFSEDALRIMRAVRFAGVLGFDVEKNTSESIIKDRFLLENIAAERISTEFVKLIMSDNTDMIYEYKKVLGVFIDKAENIQRLEAENIKTLPQKKSVRLAYFMHCLYRGYNDVNERADSALKKLKLDNKLISSTEKLIRCIQEPIPDSFTECRFFVSDFGIETVCDRMTIGIASDNASYSDYENNIKWVEQIENKGFCTKISQLEIDGNDLINAGITDGMKIGRLLRLILDEVMKENLNNKKEELLAYALRNYKKI